MTVAFSSPSYNSRTLGVWGILVLGCLTTIALSAPIRSTVVCVSTTWQDVVVFVTINYIAHAATTPTTAGAKWHDTFGWGVLALFLPFAALGKSIAMLMRHMSRAKHDDIHSAIARGAVIVVARSKKWQPQAEPQLVYVKLPSNFREIEETNPPQASAEFEFPGDPATPSPHDYIDIDLDHFEVHGRFSLPEGYALGAATVVWYEFVASERLKESSKVQLFRTRSWIKMAISVAQLFYSSITLYRTRGDQINHLGYAAFGLSVFQYTLMSAFNFICVGIVGEFPCLYILNSDILQEAVHRGGEFDGAVGIWVPEPASASPADYTAAHLSMEDDGSAGREKGTEGKILVVNAEGITRRFKFRTHSDSTRSATRKLEANHFTFAIGSVSNQDHWQPISLTQNFPTSEVILFLGAALLAYLLPYMFIFGISRFRPAQSTVAERGWMMAWLSASQLSFFPFALRSWFNPYRALSSHMCELYFAVIILALITAAIGGFVETGKMYMESGKCSLTP